MRGRHELFPFFIVKLKFVFSFSYCTFRFINCFQILIEHSFTREGTVESAPKDILFGNKNYVIFKWFLSSVNFNADHKEGQLKVSVDYVISFIILLHTQSVVLWTKL